MDRTNLVGGLTAVAFLLSALLVFVSRLVGRPEFGKWLGIFELVLVVPLVYLLIRAPSEHRPTLYYVQISAVLIWLIIEFLLDYLLKIDFRHIRWMVITYVVLFFAAAGGLVGIASSAGKLWSLVAIILFLLTAAFAFIQRKVTGM